VLYGSNQTGRVQGSVSEWFGPVNVGGNVEAFTTAGPFPEQYLERDHAFTVKNDDAQGVSASANATWEGLSVAGRISVGDRGRPGTFSTDHEGNILDCTTCHSTGSPHGKGVKYPATTTSCGQCHSQPWDREQIIRGGGIVSFDRELFSNLRFAASAYHNEWRNYYETYPDVEFFREKKAKLKETEQRLSGAEMHFSHVLGDTNNVVVGGEVRRAEVASSGIITPEGGQNVEVYEAAAFAEDEISPFRWLSITAGGRFDYSTIFGAQVSPRAGLAILPIERMALRGVFSRAFRNPNFAELHLYDPRGAYIVRGNPDLEPEVVNTYEAKLSYTFLKPLRITLAGTLYYSQADNLIGLRTTSLVDATFYNIESVNVLGSEIETEMELRSDPNIKLFANYAVQNVRDEADRVLPYAPMHKFNAGVRARKGPVNGSIRGRYVSERDDNLGITLPGFGTLDATLGLHVWDGFGVRLWAANLTDTIYQESLGIPAQRRSFFLVLYYDSSKIGL